MPNNNTDKIPSFDHNILIEAAKRLPEGLSKEYLKKLNILMQAEEDDPILAAVVVMGAYSVILGKVPDQVEEVLKSFEGTHRSKVDLDRLETRVGAMNIHCGKINKEIVAFNADLRLASNALKSFKQYLDEAEKSRNQQLASIAAALNRTSSTRKWLIVFSAIQSVTNILVFYQLWKLIH